MYKESLVDEDIFLLSRPRKCEFCENVKIRERKKKLPNTVEDSTFGVT